MRPLMHRISVILFIALLFFNQLPATAQKQPARTLLLEIRGADPAALKGTPLVYDDYIRDAVLSDVRGRTLTPRHPCGSGAAS